MKNYIYLSHETKQNQIIKHVRSAEKTKSPKSKKKLRYKWKQFQLGAHAGNQVARIKVFTCTFWPCMYQRSMS